MKIADKIKPYLIVFIENGYKVWYDTKSGKTRLSKSKRLYTLAFISLERKWVIQEIQRFEGNTSRIGPQIAVEDFIINKL